VTSKWEVRRGKRPEKRLSQGKPPLAEPLEIVSLQERREALKRGEMAFRHGETTITLPLVLPSSAGDSCPRALQGVWRVPGVGYVCARNRPATENEPEKLELYSVEPPSSSTTGLWAEQGIRYLPYATPFVYRDPSLAHVFISPVGGKARDSATAPYNGRGLAKTLVSRTSREQFSRHPPRVPFSFVGGERFKPLFEALHFSATKTQEQDPWSPSIMARKKKYRFTRLAGFSASSPFYDLSKYHAFEAIDHQTGKARLFFFTVGDAPREVRPNRELAKLLREQRTKQAKP